MYNVRLFLSAATPILIAALMQPVCAQDTSQPKTDRSDLSELFEQGGFFDQEQQTGDSLGDLLRRARKNDASNELSEQPGDLESAAKGQQRNRSNALSIDSLIDDELGDNSDRDQSEQEREAVLGRQRAMVSHLRKLQKPIHQIRVTGSHAADQMPTDRASSVLGHTPETWVTALGVAPKRYGRSTICFSHRPLYFEEIDLERCGRHHGCAQNLVSGFYFLTNAAAIPYRLATQRPDCTVASRGDCRSCQTFSNDIEPFVSCQENASGLLNEAASIAGFAFLML